LSLLHLGYNTANATTNDGWRSWMDVGIFASQSSDNVYLGMKPEETGSDAVLSWGDNSYTDASGPDNFRVIFTNPYNASTPGLYASGANGLEAMRMTPTLTAVNTGIGGDPTTNQYYGGSANPSATLEVNSWGATNVAGGSSGLRFTNLNSSSPKIANPGTGILTVDAEGDVIYVPCCSSGSVSVCGSPTSGFIPRWCGSGSDITNSIIYDDSTKVGIGTSAPANTLEINQGASGNSGLRFTQLTSSATPASNPGSGLLAVDSTGDVIYVAANNAPSIGNYCGSAPSPITANNFEVPLNMTTTTILQGQGTNPDSNFIGSSVAIGLPCGDPIPLAKLHVLQSASNPNEDSTSAAGIFENDAAGSVTVGVFGSFLRRGRKKLWRNFSCNKHPHKCSAINLWGMG
jgi:ribosomal protein L24E